MTKQAYGVCVQAQSGTFDRGGEGATVFQSNNISRMWVIPANPQTSYQQAVRTSFFAVGDAWANILSEEEREGWVKAAAKKAFMVDDEFTQTKRKNKGGKTLFIRLNMNALIARGEIGGSVIYIPTVPTLERLIPVRIESVELSSSSTFATVSYSGTLVSSTLTLQLTPALSVGVMSFKSAQCKLINLGAVQGASPLAISFDPIKYETDAGLKAFWRIYQINPDTGQRYEAGRGSSIIQT